MQEKKASPSRRRLPTTSHSADINNSHRRLSKYRARHAPLPRPQKGGRRTTPAAPLATPHTNVAKNKQACRRAGGDIHLCAPHASLMPHACNKRGTGQCAPRTLSASARASAGGRRHGAGTLTLAKKWDNSCASSACGRAAVCAWFSGSTSGPGWRTSVVTRWKNHALAGGAHSIAPPHAAARRRAALRAPLRCRNIPTPAR